MPSALRPPVLLLCSLALCLGGCSRNDTECLARLGRKLAERAEQASEEIAGKLDLDWKIAAADAGIARRVEQRLRWDRFLADAGLEVRGTGAEVELLGTVRTEQQRQRAIKLAESTVGVEKVSADALQATEP